MPRGSKARVGNAHGLRFNCSVIDGKQAQLVGKIQEKYGISRCEAEKQVDEFMSVQPSTDESGLQKL
jgi:uncharacterized protein YjbJ (UPF0337 family)